MGQEGHLALILRCHDFRLHVLGFLHVSVKDYVLLGNDPLFQNTKVKPGDLITEGSRRGTALNACTTTFKLEPADRAKQLLRGDLARVSRVRM